MCTSMDLYCQALQTNEMLFQISELFFELTTIFKNNSGIGFMQACVERECTISECTINHSC